MANVTERVAEGIFPDRPYEAEYWDETEYYGDELVHGPAPRWVVWFTDRGEPLALRQGGSILLTPRKMAARWGQYRVDEFREHIEARSETPADYDKWVDAMERAWELSNDR